jgi:nicotinate-nucleotide--dimethylbenzimidazole phosphoribosyltransferase
MTEVLRHVCDAIGAASRAHAEAARAAVAGVGAPLLDRLAAILAGAQHTPRPRAARRTIVVVIGDHGCADPGIAMGRDHPTIIAADAIASGDAALTHMARTARTPVLLVDAGAREPAALPSSAVRFGLQASRDLMTEPAMTVVEAALALDAGIALAVSLAEPGLDVVALGAVGLGSEVASAALVAAAIGRVPDGLERDDAARAAAQRGAALRGVSPLQLLATFGGADIAVMAGVMLAAASMNVPTVLDGCATGAAAVLATLLAPALPGYLVAAHLGSFAHPAALAHLGIAPVFEVGIGHGEGTGAAMVLPLLDQVAALAGRC